MLEGLEAVEVRFNEINLNDRIDAEYFAKNDLIIERVLKQNNSKLFKEFGNFVASAFYPAATQLYATGDIPFIRCVDCIDFPLITTFQDDSFEKIPRYFMEDSKGINSLNKGDIVITKVGSPCYASIVFEHNKVALSRTVLGLKNIRNINPFYLLVFLRSKYGFSQLLRQRELTIQYQLTLDRVKNIWIYSASKEFQNTVQLIIENQIDVLKKSRMLYQSAENILLSELGLKDWKAVEEAVSVKSFLDFAASGRLDAEYYQPKYDDLFAHLKKYETKPLSQIVTISKSIEPGSDAYQESGIPFVRVSNLSKHGLTEPDIHLNRATYETAELKPKKDTILLSKDASVGIAYKLEQDLDAITSGAILHLKITDKEFLPDYLTLVLNSIIVKMQAERDAGGSIIQHWKPSEIEQVIIPKLSGELQIQIAEKIQKSFVLKTESKRLLDLAKTAVEAAIEHGEEKALELLRK